MPVKAICRRCSLSSSNNSKWTDLNGLIRLSEIPTNRDREQGGALPTFIPPDLTRLSNGSRVDWVRDQSDPARMRLLVWTDGRATIQDEVEDHHKIFLPPALNRTVVKALCLPGEILPGGSPTERLNEIAETLSRHVHMADQAYYLAANVGLSTWFPEHVAVFPYLIISGPTGSGKSTLLKLLRCFCRRGMLLGDISPAALYRMTDKLNATLLLDECEFDGTRGSRTLRRFLRAGNVAGEYVARGNELFDASCPKIFCANGSIEDIALSTRAVHIAMLPSSSAGLQPLDQDTLDRIAVDHQPKLLGFRLENLERSFSLSPELARRIETFSPKLRDISRALAVPLLGDEHLESQLVQILERQDEDAVSERCHDEGWHVLKALFRYCHAPHTGEVTVGSIANEVNELRIEAEERCLTARKVGAILKALGIRTITLGSWGRGVELTWQFDRKVHALARQFGITRRDITNWMAVKSGYGGPSCDLCMEFGLTSGLRPSPPLNRHRTRQPLFSVSELEDDAQQVASETEE